jgi:hypothetical protein
MPIHLRPVPDVKAQAASKVKEVFFVVQRSNGEWDVGAKIMSVHDTEQTAQEAARKLKAAHQQRSFGVFALLGEVHVVPEPVQFVRAIGPEDAA